MGTASTKEVRRRLLQCLEQKPEIRQPGRLVAHLVNEVKLIRGSARNGTGRARLMTVLEDLESEGIIELERAGAVLNGVKLVSVPAEAPQKAVRLETTQESQAPETPTQLPEKEVVAMSNSHETTQSDPPTNVTRALEVLQGVYGASSDESAQEDFQTNVTLALQVLQGASQPSDDSTVGLLFVPSTARLLMEEFGGGLTEGYIHEMNSVLSLLGLRTSPSGNNAAGKRPHLIRMDVTEVTAAMIQEAYDRREARRVARLAEAAPQETPLVSPAVESVVANEPTSSDEEMDRAAAVIEALGKLLEEANATIEGLTQANARMRVVNEGLEQQVNELKAAKTAGSQKLRAALDAYGSLLPS